MQNIATNKVSRWADVPAVYKAIKKEKKIAFQNNPFDKGLINLLQDHVSKDDLRPTMNGIFFDENGIVATDAHRIVHLPYPNKDFKGVYCSPPSCIKVVGESQGYDLKTFFIDAKYPNYEAVFPIGNPFVHKITVQKLRTYLEAVIKGEYANKVTNQVVMEFRDGQTIGFNTKFLLHTCIFWQKLGHETIFAGFSTATRAVSISNEAAAAESPGNFIGKATITLTMPVMLSNQLKKNKYAR